MQESISQLKQKPFLNVAIIIVIITAVIRAPPLFPPVCVFETGAKNTSDAKSRMRICVVKVNGNAYFIFKGNVCLIHKFISSTDSF